MDLYGIDEAISQGNARTSSVDDYNQRVSQARDIIMNNFDTKESIDKGTKSQDELQFGIHDIASLGGAGLNLDRYQRIFSKAYSDSGKVDPSAGRVQRAGQSIASIYSGQRDIAKEVNPLLGKVVDGVGQGLGKVVVGTGGALKDAGSRVVPTISKAYSSGRSAVTGAVAPLSVPDAGGEGVQVSADTRVTSQSAPTTAINPQEEREQTATTQRPPDPEPEPAPEVDPRASFSISDTDSLGPRTTGTTRADFLASGPGTGFEGRGTISATPTAPTPERPTEAPTPQGFYEKYGKKIETGGELARVGGDVYGGISAYETLKSGVDTKDKLDETSQISGMIGTALDTIGIAVPILEPLGEIATLISLGTGEADTLEKDNKKTASVTDPNASGTPAPVGSDQANEQSQLNKEKYKVDPSRVDLNQVGLIASRSQHLGAQSSGVSSF